MPIIGYCHDCTAWVPVTAAWACPAGHPAARVNGWYDSDTGQPVAAPASAPVHDSAAVAAGTRAGFLTDLMAAFSDAPAYSAGWGADTDMTIVSNPVDGIWGLGKKRAEYTAALKVSEPDRTVYFWEMLKEQSSGLSFGTFETESYSTVGMKRSGKKKEIVVGPGAASWEWGYGTTREVVEEIATRHGFGLRVVLTRNAATW